MDQRPERDGFIARLRTHELANRLTGGRPLLLLAAPILIIAVIVAVVLVVAVAGGGNDGSDDAEARTTPGASPTLSSQGTKTPESAGLLTPIAVSPGEQLTPADLAARGAGVPARGEFTGERLLIPKLGVDAPFTVRVVGGDGQMPNPSGPKDVAWYDFSQWDGLGGLPGKGGNVVIAGHVDYINYGPAVFWDVRTLKPGDRVQIRLADGTVVEYAIEFNKRIPATDADWQAIVAGTAQESVTLITCVGAFANGSYAERQIAWGRRVS